jgi:hypothetical protein
MKYRGIHTRKEETKLLLMILGPEGALSWYLGLLKQNRNKH